MKVPKYIEKLLMKRAKLAVDFFECDEKVFKWLNEHDIWVEDEDIGSGVESLTNPYDSSYRIINTIEEK